MLPGMTDSSQTTDLGRILVTGGSGFVGSNLVAELLDRGYSVRSYDRVPSKLPDHPGLESVVGDITNPQSVTDAVEGIDTVFHTASLIPGVGETVTPEMRKRAFDVNLGGTENLLRAAQKSGVKRFVYTSSNSVVMKGDPISGGTESLPYSVREGDLYTETKVAAEKATLAQNGVDGLLTAAIRPSGIWGPGDQTMFRKLFEQVVDGKVKILLGSKEAKLDNSYVKNLVQGHILAAQHLVEGGTAPGQAYFINDGDPVNMFEFARPVVEACGQKWPTARIPGKPIHAVVTVWTRLKSKLPFLPSPPIDPVSLERVTVNNYFSIEKARRELGYQPLYTTQQGIDESLAYYKELFKDVQASR